MNVENLQFLLNKIELVSREYKVAKKKEFFNKNHFSL